jgi:hypothetical protein
VRCLAEMRAREGSVARSSGFAMIASVVRGLLWRRAAGLHRDRRTERAWRSRATRWCATWG